MGLPSEQQQQPKKPRNTLDLPLVPLAPLERAIVPVVQPGLNGFVLCGSRSERGRAPPADRVARPVPFSSVLAAPGNGVMVKWGCPATTPCGDCPELELDHEGELHEEVELDDEGELCFITPGARAMMAQEAAAASVQGSMMGTGRRTPPPGAATPLLVPPHAGMDLDDSPV